VAGQGATTLTHLAARPHTLLASLSPTKVDNAATMLPPCRHNAANNAAMPPTKPLEAWHAATKPPTMPPVRLVEELPTLVDNPPVGGCRHAVTRLPTMPPCRQQCRHNAANATRQGRHAAMPPNNAARGVACRHNAATQCRQSSRQCRHCMPPQCRQAIWRHCQPCTDAEGEGDGEEEEEEEEEDEENG
jgi:hypothetical protein